MRRPPQPIAGLAYLVLAVMSLLPAAPAAAAPGDSRAVQLTRELRRDPVYVSPSLSRVVTPEQIAELRRQVAAMPYPTFVAIVPSFPEEPGNRLFGDLITILRERLGRDGLYVIHDGSGYQLAAEAFGVRTRGEINRVGSLALDAVPTRDGPIPRVRFALDHLASGRQAEYSVAAKREADDRLPLLVLASGGVVGLVVPLGIAAALPSSRRRRADARARRARLRNAQPWPDPAILSPDPDEMRRKAQDAVAELSRAVDAAPSPPDEALRAYEAASQVLSRTDALPVDHVGVVVLANRGQGALKGAIPPPCFFDPRHGDGLRASRWRRDNEDVAIPVCATCAKALAGDLTPLSLGDRDRPYWEQDTVWARTGFGAIDDRIADVVLAGPVGR